MFGLLPDPEREHRTLRVARCVAPNGDVWLAWPQGSAHVSAPVAPVTRRSRRAAPPTALDGPIVAPCAGCVTRREAPEGASVTAGQRIGVLEAMKMEFALVAPISGLVRWALGSDGRVVQKGAVLAEIESEKSTQR